MKSTTEWNYRAAIGELSAKLAMATLPKNATGGQIIDKATEIANDVYGRFDLGGIGTETALRQSKGKP